MSREEYRFTLQTRRDKNGDEYFFGSMKFFDSVMFVRKMPRMEGEPQLYEVSVKPYRARKEDDEDVWEEDTLEETQDGNRTRTSPQSRRRT